MKALNINPLCYFLLFLLLLINSYTAEGVFRTGHNQPAVENDTTIMRLADPTIFFHKGVYYLYGTGGDVGKGFLVYTSNDMKNWQGPVGARDGYALVEGDSYGTSGFWAPQVFHHKKKFYMAYTANEHIAIAESDHPIGPFKQKMIKPISGPGKQIDPFVFFDKGKTYLYHVRLTSGNRLFVAELMGDLSDIRPETARECLAATEPWENTLNASWPVAEGPTVMKRKGLYYLFYSANDFRNKDYAVGYATSNNPFGPWMKYENNPVISRNTLGINGTGHGDFFKSRDGALFYVFHTHASASQVQPRLTAVIEGRFDRVKGDADRLIIQENTFRYLYLGKK